MVIRAVFEKGLFRPLGPVPKLGEHSEVFLTVSKPLNVHSLRKVRGRLSVDDAEKMQKLIREGRRSAEFALIHGFG